MKVIAGGWRYGLASSGGNETEAIPGVQRYNKYTYVSINIYIHISLYIFNYRSNHAYILTYPYYGLRAKICGLVGWAGAPRGQRG